MAGAAAGAPRAASAEVAGASGAPPVGAAAGKPKETTFPTSGRACSESRHRDRSVQSHAAGLKRWPQPVRAAIGELTDIGDRDRPLPARQDGPDREAALDRCEFVSSSVLDGWSEKAEAERDTFYSYLVTSASV